MEQKRKQIIHALFLLIVLISGVFTARAEDEAETAAPAPAAPVPEYPQGELISRSAGFYWTPSENADRYEVNWENDWGGKGSEEIRAADSSCGSGRCVVYMELPAEGNYTWTVTAFNDGGSAASEAMSFTVRPMLKSAKAYRPDTRIEIGRTLTFEWEDTGEKASEFRIQAADSETDRICLDQRFPAAGIYAGNGVRVLNTGLYLPAGAYRWRVQAINDSAVSGWSRWTDFSVVCSACELGTYSNTTSAAVFPSGQITDPAPVFEWLNVTGAVNFVLKITDAAGNEVLNESVSAENCDFRYCTYQPAAVFTPGQVYRWSAETHGWNNIFWGSGEGSFMITEAAPAPAAQLSFVLPEEGGKLDEENPEIIWTDPGDPNSTFRIVILDPSGSVLLYTDLTRDDAWCDGLTCSVQFRTIPEGEGYQAVLAAYSEFNTPGDPIMRTFSK